MSEELNTIGTEPDLQFPRPFLVWCLAFAYASFLAIALQKLLLPLAPSLHAQHGLLQHDAIFFHNVAVDLADRIRTFGWSEWRLFPGQGSTGNVGLLAVLYALLGPDPAWFIPFNAAAHAGGALMLYLLGPVISPGNSGRLGGLVAAILFLAFPSALQWYGQNHKDAFCILGTLIILYTWLRVLQCRDFRSEFTKHLLLAIMGAALVNFVRPYLLLVLAGALLTSGLAFTLIVAIQKRIWIEKAKIAFGLLLIALLLGANYFAPQDREVVPGGDFSNVTREMKWTWHKSQILPRKLDGVLERVALVRLGFASYGLSVGASSQIDANRIPDDAIGVLGYMPRALAIGLFAPFPDSWLDRPSLPRIIGAVETLIWYVIAMALLVVMFRPSQTLFIGAIFCASVIAVLAYVHPNVGTLYRHRFGVLFFFILCGAIGWSRILIHILSTASFKSTNEFPREKVAFPTAALAPSSTMVTVVASGAIVLSITLIGFLGFMVRDLLLVKQFGMSTRLDAFFSAAMVPMFFVSFLALPFSDAITSGFLHVGANEGSARQNSMINSILCVACLILGLVGLLLIAMASHVVGLVLHSADRDQLEEATRMLRLCVPILIFSGWTVIGNAALNALHRSRLVALAQLVVPLTAISTFIFFGNQFGLYAVIYGMLLGLALNILIVIYAMRALGMQLMPIFKHWSSASTEALTNYALLAVAAMFVAITVPINYGFANTIGPGAVSAWALGSKMVQLVTGIAGVAIGAVVLPHLGHLMASGQTGQLKKDIYFLLMVGTWISVAITLVIFCFSEAIVVAIFEGGQVSEPQAIQLAEILKLGSLQLPFVLATTLILKLAAVSGASLKAVIASGAGLVLNVCLNFILVSQSGVIGLATASVISGGVSAGVFVILARKQCGMGFVEAAALIGGWIVLLGLSVALNFKSVAAITSMGIALLILNGAQWFVWKGPLNTQVSGKT